MIKKNLCNKIKIRPMISALVIFGSTLYVTESNAQFQCMIQDPAHTAIYTTWNCGGACVAPAQCRGTTPWNGQRPQNFQCMIQDPAHTTIYTTPHCEGACVAPAQCRKTTRGGHHRSGGHHHGCRGAGCHRGGA